MCALGCIIPEYHVYAHLAPDISAMAFFSLLVSIILVLIGFLAYMICAFGTSQQKNWYEKIELNVYAWDAGTEEGNGYSLDNIETDPQEEISPFVAGTTAAAVFVSVGSGGFEVKPVATLTFELQESSSKCDN